ncbi:hypothetical protein BAE44_0022825 [Dichanthelium oligosanthes]|uniref:Uncharacterized protein n=1 Tax=Dichanthelium oligosanthes TaxID=888268 RepID=A0A1E5UTE4_9POAL|nr:hypothetical protein BAE44_0022825 [Dichanthelium oligosanthes]
MTAPPHVQLSTAFRSPSQLVIAQGGGSEGTMSWAKKVVNKVKAVHTRLHSGNLRSSCGTNSPALRYAMDAMSMDSILQSATTQEEKQIKIRVLTLKEQIVLQTDQERQAFTMLKDQTFKHTRVYDKSLLVSVSFLGDFEEAILSIGWNNFLDISEQGSRLLTLNSLAP